MEKVFEKNFKQISEVEGLEEEKIDGKIDLLEGNDEDDHLHLLESAQNSDEDEEQIKKNLR